MTAHFFNAPKKAFTLILSQDARPIGEEIRLEGTKAEAKAKALEIAKARGAKPWNF